MHVHNIILRTGTTCEMYNMVSILVSSALPKPHRIIYAYASSNMFLALQPWVCHLKKTHTIDEFLPLITNHSSAVKLSTRPIGLMRRYLGTTSYGGGVVRVHHHRKFLITLRPSRAGVLEACCEINHFRINFLLMPRVTTVQKTLTKS